MKSRVKYDPDRSMWKIEIITDEGWELCKAWKAKIMGPSLAYVSDEILDELRRMALSGWEITFDD